MRIPTREECLRMLKDNKVPANIVAHLNAVHDFSMRVCDVLENRGIKVNRDLVAAASLLHDIKKASSNDHIKEGYELLKFLEFPEVAEVVRKHGLEHMHKNDFVPNTWEEKIVFYSDKRVKGDKVVSVDERFEYIKQRYKKEHVDLEINFTKNIEKELLGNEKL